MKEEIKLFVQKLANDKEFQEKLQGCKTPEEAYAIASSVQEGFTYEEFVETMTKLYAFANQESLELTDEDLAMAAGGEGPGVSETVLTGVISAAAAAGTFF